LVLIFLCGEWHPALLWPYGWMDEDATWYGSRHRRRPRSIRRVPSAPRKGHSTPSPLLGPCLLWPRSPILATAELLYIRMYASMKIQKLPRGISIFVFFSPSKYQKQNGHNCLVCDHRIEIICTLFSNDEKYNLKTAPCLKKGHPFFE